MVLSRNALLGRYGEIRAFTEKLCAPLETEDYVVQSMPDASPAKWHLGHTTWFFETFVLRRAVLGYRPLDERWAYLFNSYYRSAGDRHPQPRRGLLSRPTVAQVYEYRRGVDRQVERFLEDAPQNRLDEHAFVIELGLHHEQQHQELVLTDIKHLFAQNPLAPSYWAEPPLPQGRSVAGARRWIPIERPDAQVGHAGQDFAYDNELPRHRVHLEPFEISSRLVTCGEFVEFIEDGGYRRPDLWLSDGWDICERFGWQAPLYWQLVEGRWTQITLRGRQLVEPLEPVGHVSYYEADAFARWAGARLPLEQEWEIAAIEAEVQGNFVESGRLHPSSAPAGEGRLPSQMYGDLWEWTGSAYAPYPGYRPFAGALGEYNGKFMSGRMVLRGGSCVTPASHIRPSYRNFFPPETRWQFSGIRLARWPETSGRGSRAGDE